MSRCGDVLVGRDFGAEGTCSSLRPRAWTHTTADRTASHCSAPQGGRLPAVEAPLPGGFSSLPPPQPPLPFIRFLSNRFGNLSDPGKQPECRTAGRLPWSPRSGSTVFSSVCPQPTPGPGRGRQSPSSIVLAISTCSAEIPPSLFCKARWEVTVFAHSRRLPRGAFQSCLFHAQLTRRQAGGCPCRQGPIGVSPLLVFSGKCCLGFPMVYKFSQTALSVCLILSHSPSHTS